MPPPWLPALVSAWIAVTSPARCAGLLLVWTSRDWVMGEHCRFMTGWGWMTPGGRLATLSVCALTSWLSLGAGMVLCCAGRRLWCGDEWPSRLCERLRLQRLGEAKGACAAFLEQLQRSGCLLALLEALYEHQSLAATAGTHGRVIWEACTSAASVGVCGAACGLESACGIPCVGACPLLLVLLLRVVLLRAASYVSPLLRSGMPQEQSMQCLGPLLQPAGHVSSVWVHRTCPCFVVHALPHTERDLPYHLQ